MHQTYISHVTLMTDLSNMGSNAGNWKKKQAREAPHGSAPGANIRHIDVAEPMLGVKCQRGETTRTRGGCMSVSHTDLLTSWKGKQKVPDWIGREVGWFSHKGGNKHGQSMD